MYDIEGKYKKLMIIANGKVPLLKRNDKQKKIQGMNDKVFAAERIIVNCQKDEKRMLRYKVIESLGVAERMKSIFDVMNICIAGLTLLASVIGTKELPDEQWIIVLRTIAIAVIAYALIILGCVIHQNKEIKNNRFLLQLFEE